MSHTYLLRAQLILGQTYWFKYIIVTPNQLTAAALVIQYWCPPEKVNPGVFITVFFVVIVCINYFGVRFFGELEFWLSSLKVIVIVALIILSLVLALGGGPTHDRTGFRYWKDPGAFKPYLSGKRIYTSCVLSRANGAQMVPSASFLASGTP